MQQPRRQQPCFSERDSTSSSFSLIGAWHHFSGPKPWSTRHCCLPLTLTKTRQRPRMPAHDVLVHSCCCPSPNPRQWEPAETAEATDGYDWRPCGPCQRTPGASSLPGVVCSRRRRHNNTRSVSRQIQFSVFPLDFEGIEKRSKNRCTEINTKKTFLL